VGADFEVVDDDKRSKFQTFRAPAAISPRSACPDRNQPAAKQPLNPNLQPYGQNKNQAIGDRVLVKHSKKRSKSAGHHHSRSARRTAGGRDHALGTARKTRRQGPALRMVGRPVLISKYGGHRGEIRGGEIHLVAKTTSSASSAETGVPLLNHTLN